MNARIGVCFTTAALAAACGGSGGAREEAPPPDEQAATPPPAAVDSGAAADAGTHDSGHDAHRAHDAAPRTHPDAAKPATCRGKAAQSNGDSTWTIATTTSGSRTAIVHIPTGYDPTAATPIVLNFHGYAGSSSQEELLSKMDPESDAKGFVAVYPMGTGPLASWNAGACCGTAVSDDVDDIGFVSTLLDTLEEKLCVDADRVFATGMSNGGFFAQRLGCELANRIAAIAPVAGVMGMPTCTPSRPMPVIEFHGTSDDVVPYDGDALIGYTSVADTIAGWVSRNGCTAAPVTTYSNGDASCVTYGSCSAGADVILCTIQGGGHTWPGGTPIPILGATSTDISATDTMWAFFTAHTM